MPQRYKILRRAGHGFHVALPGLAGSPPTPAGGGDTTGPGGGLSAADIDSIMASFFDDLGGGSSSSGPQPLPFTSSAEAFYADLGLRKQEFGLAQGAQNAQKAQFARNLVFLEKQLAQEGRLTQQQINNTLLDIRNRFKISSQEMDIARDRLRLDRFTGISGVRQEDTRLGLQARAQLETERGAQAERASNPRRILEAIFAQTGRTPTDEATRLQNVASTGTGALGRFAHGGVPNTTPTAPPPGSIGTRGGEVPSPLGSAARAMGLLPAGAVEDFIGPQSPSISTPTPPPGGVQSGGFSDLDFSGVDDERLMQQLSQAQGIPDVGPRSGVPGPNVDSAALAAVTEVNSSTAKKPSAKVLQEMFEAFSGGGIFDDVSPRKRAYKTIAAVNLIMKNEKIDRLSAVKRLQSVGRVLDMFSAGATPTSPRLRNRGAGGLNRDDVQRVFHKFQTNLALQNRAEGGTANGEFVLVGEGKNDEGVKAGTAEFLFAPPGTVIAPVGNEPLTSAGAARAVTKQLKRAAHGGTVGLGGVLGGGVGGPSSLGTPRRTIPASNPAVRAPILRTTSAASKDISIPGGEKTSLFEEPRASDFLGDRFDLDALDRGELIDLQGNPITTPPLNPLSPGGGKDGTEVPSNTPGSTTPQEDNLLKLFEMSVAGQLRFGEAGVAGINELQLITGALDPKLLRIAMDEASGVAKVGSFAEAAQKQIDELKARLFDEQQKAFTEVGLDAAAGQSRSSLFNPLGGSTFTDQQAEFLKSLNLRTKTNLSPTGQGVLDAVLSSNRVSPEDYDAFLNRSFAGFNPVGQQGASFGGLI